MSTTDAALYVLVAATIQYGNEMLGDGASNPREVILVVLSMLFCGARVGQAIQQIDYFNSAISAANDIFPIIDRVNYNPVFIN